jgi:hypothetical protein
VLLGLVSAPTAWRLRAIEQQYQQFLLIGLLAILLLGGRVILPIVNTLFEALTGVSLGGV